MHVQMNIALSVDCIWSEWQAWSPCPDCYGDRSGFYRKDLKSYKQTRMRRVKTRAKYNERYV